MKRMILILALVLAGLPIGMVALSPMPDAEAQAAVAPLYSSLGEALYAQGRRQSIGLPDGSGKVITGVFNPAINYDGRFIGPATRYGFPSLVIGYLRGPEGTSREMLEEVIRHPSNPFRIRGNLTYNATVNDYYDALFVRSTGRRCVWHDVDDLRVRLGVSQPPPGPPPVVTPPPPVVLPPVVEPPKPEPTPEIPPCSFDPEGVQPEAVITPKVIGWTYYRPGTQSTGRLTLEVVAERPCRVVKP